MQSAGDGAHRPGDWPGSSALKCPFLAAPPPPRLETGREDERLHCAELEREVSELQQRNQALTSLAQEAQALKDEMDELRCVVDPGVPTACCPWHRVPLIP